MKATSTSQCDRPLSATAFVKSNRRTKSLTLSNSRWLAYATAGIASGFGLASAAEGEIHYSGLVNVKMGGVQMATLPLTGGASLQFFIYDLGSGSDYASATFAIPGAESAAARRSFFGQVEDVKNGSPVSLGPFTSVPHRGNIRSKYRPPKHFCQTRWRFYWIQVQYWKRYPIWLGPAEAAGGPSPPFFLPLCHQGLCVG